MYFLRKNIITLVLVMFIKDANGQGTKVLPLAFRVPLMHLQGLDFMTPRLGVEYCNPNANYALALELGMPVKSTTNDINSTGYFIAAQVGNFWANEKRRVSHLIGLRASALKGVYHDYLKTEFKSGTLNYQNYLYSRVEKNRMRIGLVDMVNLKLYKKLALEFQIEAGYSKMEVVVPESVSQVSFYNGLFIRTKYYDGFYMGLGLNLYYSLI